MVMLKAGPDWGEEPGLPPPSLPGDKESVPSNQGSKQVTGVTEYLWISIIIIIIIMIVIIIVIVVVIIITKIITINYHPPSKPFFTPSLKILEMQY